MATENRTIDAYTLAEEIESLQITVAGKPARWNDAKHSVLRIIAEQPDVDAVEVVRCKDCDNTCPGNNGIVCTIWGAGTQPDSFCSHGERRTDHG